MKLDTRIENEHLICTPFSDAKMLLNEYGYFAKIYESFYDLKRLEYGELTDFNPDLGFPYKCNDGEQWYGYFIPEKSLKKNIFKEKIFRPFTLEEFQRNFEIGKPIKFRRKWNSTSETCLIYLGYSFSEIEHQYFECILIGNNSYYLDELFEKYEYYKDDKWIPFGLEE